MKHFLVEITYTAEPDQMAAIRPEHRAYVKTGFDGGLLLFSGPRNPMTGGLVVARMKSREDVERFFAKDPFQLNKLATYRFIEFDPVFFQPFLEDWMKG
ncbi:hypothetical protein EHM69_07840 [candidate division KSB1 bacterium]|nr:MAG: hypothetical protein EHM69_07840 [candidate division KSB1 bacterium]